MPSPSFIPVIKTATAGDFTLGGNLNISGLIQSTRVIATDVVMAAILPGDTFDRYRRYADGKAEWGPGNGARDTNLYRSAASSLTTDSFFSMGSGQSSGNFTTFANGPTALRCGSAGGGLAVKEGANARMGTLVLTGATPVVVANTSVTVNTRIFLTTNTPGGTPGFNWVSAKTAATSFAVTGTAGDTSTVAYLLVEAP